MKRGLMTFLEYAASTLTIIACAFTGPQVGLPSHTECFAYYTVQWTLLKVTANRVLPPGVKIELDTNFMGNRLRNYER